MTDTDTSTAAVERLITKLLFISLHPYVGAVSVPAVMSALLQERDAIIAERDALRWQLDAVINETGMSRPKAPGGE